VIDEVILQPMALQQVLTVPYLVRERSTNRGFGRLGGAMGPSPSSSSIQEGNVSNAMLSIVEGVDSIFEMG
jgi:hypothetical protein